MARDLTLLVETLKHKMYRLSAEISTRLTDGRQPDPRQTGESEVVVAD